MATNRQGVAEPRVKSGRSPDDPTENVKALSEAANKRQDDLREANDKLQVSEIRRLEGSIECLKEVAELRETHAKEMREKEVARLDSIRQVDVTAVRTEADRALAAIQTLAATTATNAENLRNALNAAAATVAKSTSDMFSPINERVAALEKSSYEGVGKQRLADPMITELMAKVESLGAAKNLGTGVTQGVDKMWGVVAVVATLIIAGTVAFVTVNRPQPQVIYAPVPNSIPK